MLHDRIDPTVELLRKKPLNLNRKRINKDKITTSAPPIGAPSWCLNKSALIKLGRESDNIPSYDDSGEDVQDDDIQDHEDHDTNNEDDNNVDLRGESSHKRKKKSKSHKKALKQKKKEKKHKSKKRRK